jgi:hypothetical protein
LVCPSLIPSTLKTHKNYQVWLLEVLVESKTLSFLQGLVEEFTLGMSGPQFLREVSA